MNLKRFVILSLVCLLIGVIANDLLAVTLIGPEFLGLARHVVGDDRVRGIEDGA